MALTRIKGSNIADGTVVEADIADNSVTATKLDATLDLSSKSVTLASGAVTPHVTDPTKASIEALGIDVPATNLTGVKTVGGISIAGSGDIPVDTVTKSASDPAVDTNGAVGDQWVNTTSGEMFVCTDATAGSNVWKNTGAGSGNIAPYSIDYLVIAGGGGANGAFGGGGGAGGYRNSYNNETSGGNSSSESAIVATPNTVYNIVVGAGGAGAPEIYGSTSGSNSSFGSITSIGGGHGHGGSGGSGGGYSRHAGSGGAGTTGQGHSGGTQTLNNDRTGSGGGGAGQVGGNDGSGGGTCGAHAGNGGNGLSSSITDSAVTRAGGGGGGTRDQGCYDQAGSGGSGGGGDAGHHTAGQAGTANTGSGGGAGQYQYDGMYHAGGNGGTGVVILRMPTSGYTGTTTGSPTVSTSGSDTILTFNSSGTYTG